MVCYREFHDGPQTKMIQNGIRIETYMGKVSAFAVALGHWARANARIANLDVNRVTSEGTRIANDAGTMGVGWEGTVLRMGGRVELEKKWFREVWR
jgi:hypothetical protein